MRRQTMVAVVTGVQTCALPIFSTAQQASPKVMGHSEPFFAQFRNLSALVVMKPSFIMPSIAIILPIAWYCLKPGAAGALIPTTIRSFPVERALLPFVNKAHRQHRQKHDERPEPDQAARAVGNGPGKPAGDFQTDKHEQRMKKRRSG